MNLFKKYSRCRGLVLLRLGKWMVELWRCPFGEVVEPHTHPKQDSWLMFLCGECVVGKVAEQKREIAVTGKWFNPPIFFISGATPHWIKRISATIWILNISKTETKQSVADNFVTTNV